ncbi:MAG: hypothetical protein IPM82_13965 [Saprospiraceae bacterium]|nr:hypothetical protein [Saprospiraceae bacterium]
MNGFEKNLGKSLKIKQLKGILAQLKLNSDETEPPISFVQSFDVENFFQTVTDSAQKPSFTVNE